MPTATVNGLRLHYLDEGHGPPVVLLHAFPLTSEMWEPQIAALAPGHRVIAPDLRGFGGSDAPDDVGQYSMAAFASDVAALVDHLDLGPVVLGGLSMGGYVTFEMLRRHRSLVSAVILADTRAAADSPEAKVRRSGQQEEIRAGDVSGVLDTLIKGLLSEATHRDRPEVVARVRAIMDSVPTQGLVGALEAMKGRPDASDELAGIDLPTVVIVGTQDALSPPDVAAAMVDRLPEGRLVEIAGAGHLSNIEQPAAFDDALQAFLGQLSRT